MEVKFEVKMTAKLMYHFMLNHTYKSLQGFLGTAFGVASLVMFGVTFGKAGMSYSILYLVFGIWFLLYLPFSLYLRSRQQIQKNAVFGKPVTYVVNEKGIEVIQEEQKAECGWDQIFKVRKTSKCILVYTSQRNAFVFDRAALGTQYDALCGLLRSHLPEKKVKL